ncbi:MBL fold metallo-hydrolase [Clostridia bacterium]|nr:MBL fold metallo-hydrolase [Clostridia bacterium]
MLYHEALIRDINAAQPAYGALSFWWLGQMGLCVKTARHTLWFDPYLEESQLRQFPPPLLPDEITNADFVFGSHDHSDHISRDTFARIGRSSPNARFIVPGNLAEQLAADTGISRYIGIDDGQTYTAGDAEQRAEIQITGIAAAHELLTPDADGRFANIIYVVRVDGVTICHMGDTCIYDGLTAKLSAISPIDLLMLPINGRDGKRLRSGCIGNMTYQEAVDLAGTLAPRLTIPGHYDMFADNSENPALFAHYAEIKYPGLDFWIGQHSRRIEQHAAAPQILC